MSSYAPAQIPPSPVLGLELRVDFASQNGTNLYLDHAILFDFYTLHVCKKKHRKNIRRIRRLWVEFLQNGLSKDNKIIQTYRIHIAAQISYI